MFNKGHYYYILLLLLLLLSLLSLLYINIIIIIVIIIMNDMNLYYCMFNKGQISQNIFEVNRQVMHRLLCFAVDNTDEKSL